MSKFLTCLLLLFWSANSVSAQTSIRRPESNDSRLDWLFSPSISPEARAQLLPLYQRELALLNELNFNKWRFLAEHSQQLGAALAGAAASALPAAATLVEESAARAGQRGAAIRGENAALAAQDLPDEVPSATRGRAIILELDRTRKQIGAIRMKFGIETIGPATFRPKELSDENLARIVSSMGSVAAKPITPATIPPALAPPSSASAPRDCSGKADAVARYERSVANDEWFVANTSGEAQGLWANTLQTSRRFLAEARTELAECLRP
jgi:hypothetical protein